MKDFPTCRIVDVHVYQLCDACTRLRLYVFGKKVVIWFQKNYKPFTLSIQILQGTKKKRGKRKGRREGEKKKEGLTFRNNQIFLFNYITGGLGGGALQTLALSF